MSSRCLLDAEALLALGAFQRKADVPQAELYLSIVTVDELLRVANAAETAGQRVCRNAWVEAVLADVPILELDEKTVRVHARIVADTGKLHPTDRWLGAACLAHGMELWTGRPAVFKDFPGLKWQAVTD